MRKMKKKRHNQVEKINRKKARALQLKNFDDRFSDKQISLFVFSKLPLTSFVDILRRVQEEQQDPFRFQRTEKQWDTERIHN